MKEKTHLGNRLLSVLLTFLMLLSLLPSAALAADTQQIALMAVTQNGFLIEPEYVTYHSGDTVKDVLKKSSHTFSGIDSGYITAVDGTTDNFTIHVQKCTTTVTRVNCRICLNQVCCIRMDTSWISRRMA